MRIELWWEIIPAYLNIRDSCEWAVCFISAVLQTFRRRCTHFCERGSQSTFAQATLLRAMWWSCCRLGCHASESDLPALSPLAALCNLCSFRFDPKLTFARDKIKRIGSLAVSSQVSNVARLAHCCWYQHAARLLTLGSFVSAARAPRGNIDGREPDRLVCYVIGASSGSGSDHWASVVIRSERMNLCWASVKTRVSNVDLRYVKRCFT